MQTYPTGYAESHRIAEQIFREILPRHGMAVREEQIALCHEVLDTLYNKEISLCEAGVGTGKTLAYLVGCILWQMHRPERMKLPIVISTSSVALQDAILTEYLPDLSAILLDEGIITAPITAVVRKGKERFVCDARLAERASLVQPSRKRQTNSLNIAAHILDMDHIPELSRYDRCRICVPQSCPRDCFMRLDCRYQQYLRDSMKPDIQICNHNYLLADASHRLALPELDADAIIDKILRRAELQFNYCAAGDDDPTTMQIKRACKEFKPTDTFPESFYSSIVSKIILHLDTHIDIKLRNGQTL